MPLATVRTIYEWLDTVAPFERQEEGDNSGLLIGSMARPVERVLLALDVTPQVLDEARALDAQLIVSHHPLMFSPVQAIAEDDCEGALIARMIRESRALISAHTNADQSEYSGTRAVLDLLQLSQPRREGPYVWAGELAAPMCVDALCGRIAAALGGTPVPHGPGGRMIRTVAVAGGSCSQGYAEARVLGAQTLVTGEVRHHHALAANACGVTLIAAGHVETETPMLMPLARGLQNYLDHLQYTSAVHVSSLHPYGR